METTNRGMHPLPCGTYRQAPGQEPYVAFLAPAVTKAAWHRRDRRFPLRGLC
ncbi:hypothetical protein GCM10010218_59990 [Streptomyces mashuensis]|uniref:Uncharacterized protein n=1 Tax=Streptomyces mashuensis TaxID=33904 RepID=A0A919B941_9ACTN|nr:hypothetical protein GCM10010218_59990 [Streptomyces mashuensis]